LLLLLMVCGGALGSYPPAARIALIGIFVEYALSERLGSQVPSFRMSLLLLLLMDVGAAAAAAAAAHGWDVVVAAAALG